MSRSFPLGLALAGTLVVASGGVSVWAADSEFKKAPMSDDPMELYTQGAVLVATGELDAAETFANAAMKAHPEAYGFHLLLGDVASRRKHDADAFYEWQWEFLRSGPGTTIGDLASSRISNLLSSGRGTEVDEVRLVLDAVMLTVKDPKTAFGKMEKVQNERGNKFALREFMAEALHKGGQFDRAESLYRELLDEDPAFVAGYVQLATLLKSKGREQEATQLMLKARSIDPKNWRLRGM